jgi:hypothetical protein
MKNLLTKISESISKGAKKVAYEFSYQTGIGWKYEERDEYKDHLSREIQRYSPNISVNNRIARLSMSGGGHYLSDFAKKMEESDNKQNLELAKDKLAKMVKNIGLKNN